ncbi:MAG: hypothetical protein U0228_25775 [Myxococcaceae bacterium]
MRSLCFVVVLLAAHALAFDKGASLWVAGNGVVLLADAKDKAKPLAPLAAGTEVKWLGASPKDKRFHQVEFAGKKGFVFLSQLTPNKPAAEVITPDNSKPAPPPPQVALPPPPTADAQTLESLDKLEQLNRAITAADVTRREAAIK